MPSISQERRVARIDTPLGKDVLGLARYDITEGMSELFEWRVEVISEESDIDFESLLGEGCSIKHKSQSTTRLFHARLVEAQNVGVRGRYRVYNLLMRPWLWLLSRNSDCRIYEEKMVDEIIKDVFDRRGFRNNVDYEFRLQGKHEKREYTVQYRETDLAFVCRLMEEEGIFYFFEHKEDRHICVLGDSKAAARPCAGLPKVPFFPYAGGEWLGEERVLDWHMERRVRTAKSVLNDYDFKAPGKSLKATSEAKGKFEFYDHPANYKERGTGDQRAQVRGDAEQAYDKRRYCNGDAAPMYPGSLIKLERLPEESENVEYLIVRASHTYTTEAYETTSDPSGAIDAYSGTYELQASDRPYRCPLMTPRPVVYGMHTGKVCGPSGEEIHVDEHGRILVEFYWDRQRGYDKPKTHSRWTRVAQLWAGPGWGGQFIPRIGQEVVVIYEEGDPDHPIVIGGVYNGENAFPYPMPKQKTQSGVKSDTYKGSGYNEFMFEDVEDGEFIRMHAQKDHKVTVLDAETWDIGAEFTGSSERTTPSRTTVLHKGADHLTLKKGDQKLTLSEGSRIVDIKDLLDTTIRGKEKREVKKSITTHAVEEIDIKSDKKINLQVGNNRITIEQSGITINGMMVYIN